MTPPKELEISSSDFDDAVSEMVGGVEELWDFDGVDDTSCCSSKC